MNQDIFIKSQCVDNNTKQTSKQTQCVLRERPHRRPRVPCDTTQGGGLVKGQEPFVLHYKRMNHYAVKN